MKELLLFQAGNIQFGLDLPLVKSIHGVNARFTEQADRSHKLIQVMDGEEFLLYDLPSIFRDEASSGDPMSQKVILVESHENPIALGVDRVEQVISVNIDRIQPLPPIFNGLPLSCFPRVLKHEDELILLFNPEGIENLDSEIPDTKTDPSEPEVVKSSLEDKKIPEPITKTQAAPDINETPQDSGQKSIIGNGEPASDISYSESIPPIETEKEQSDLGDYLSETIDINPDFEEGTASRLVEKERIAREEQAQQEQVGSELLAIGDSFAETTPGTEDSDVQDTEEKVAAADVDETAAETSPEDGKVEMGMGDNHFETASVDLATESYADMPDETQYVEGKDEHDGENLFFPSADISLDSKDESGLPFERGKPVAGDASSQMAVVQPEGIIYLKEAKAALETPEPESADHLRFAKEDTNVPPLPVGNVPYLFAAVSTESEPIPIEPAEEVSLKEAEAKVETLEEESTDPFRSAKENKDMPPLPLGEVPYLFAAVSTESEPIPIEPAEEVSLKEAETEVEIQQSESPDHLGSEKEDTATLLMPGREKPSLVDLASIESEPISKEPSHAIFLNSSDIVTPSSGNRSEKILTPTGLRQELGIDHGKRKGSYKRPVALGVLLLVTLLLLSMWLWPKRSPQVPEAVIKSVPIVYAAQEVGENENQDLSQTPKPLNTIEKSTGSAQASLRAGQEVLKIETNDFTLTVERPNAAAKNGRQPVSAGMTGENELSHIVVKNDTLWQIAKRYLDDPFRYPELAKTSRISNPDQIYPGDVVRIIKKKKQWEGKQGESSQERSKDGSR